MEFDFDINSDGLSSEAISPEQAKGRLVEDVDIMGNRRFAKEEIIAWIKTRPGDTYDADQIKQDFNAILAKGYFDKLQSRVTTTDAIRGGVAVIFEVVELPLITEVKFEGLNNSDQVAVINEIAKQRIEIRQGAPFDSGDVKQAIKVIEDFFQSQGWLNVKAETFVETISATEVRVIFKISGHNFGS
jgi:outer membrane protein insertion porin family